MEKINLTIQTACLDCGGKLVGRRDKKFCCDQCRSSYFNKMHAEHNHYMRKINNVLRKNRRILQDFFHRGMTRVGSGLLQHKGFSFDHFTQEVHLNGNIKHKCCYEYGYYKTEDDKIIILQLPDPTSHEVL